MIGKVAGARKYALFHHPGIRADFQHVEIVIGFEDKTIGFAEMDFDEFRHVAEIGADGHFSAIGAKSEADGIDGVMRDGEGMNINIANTETLAGLNGLDAAQALAESLGKNALKSTHGGSSDIERGLPETEDLRETVAMIGVLVGDEDCVEMIEAALDGGKPSEGFAFAEPSIYKDAGAFGFEQREIARTARSQNGDAQADWKCPRRTRAYEPASQHKTVKIMAERASSVNG